MPTPRLPTIDATALAALAFARAKQDMAAIPRLDFDSYEPWLRTFFGKYLENRKGEPVPFGPMQDEFWRWVWALEPGVHPPALIAVWSRDMGKSTSSELAVPVLGARRTRRYGLYVSGTQDMADGHVQNIAGLLEHPGFARAYPDVASRSVNKYGAVRGWRRNRLVTASGMVVDAAGLEKGLRGVKFDEARPDFIILDDIDDKEDTPNDVDRKIRVLTSTILAAGAHDCAVIGVQNLIHGGSIFAKLTDGRADFLLDRRISGPHPAIIDLQAEQRDGRWVITGGTPSWVGLGLEACQDLLNQIGYTAFLHECQHLVEARAGGMFNHLSYQRIRRDELPVLQKVVVWVDPAVTSTDNADSQAVQVDGLGEDKRIYRLFSWEQRTTPLTALRMAIRKALEYRAPYIGIETDQGGETWRSVFREAWVAECGDLLGPTPLISMRDAKAASAQTSKAGRAQQMLVDYENGRFVHVLGTHETLERSLFRFPAVKPYDLVDAAYWAWSDLVGQTKGNWGWTQYAQGKAAQLRARRLAAEELAEDRRTVAKAPPRRRQLAGLLEEDDDA